MQVRTFICFMLLLLAFTAALLVWATPLPSEAQQPENSGGDAGSNKIQVQTTDGSVILESVSRHLLSVVQ